MGFFGISTGKQKALVIGGKSKREERAEKKREKRERKLTKLREQTQYYHALSARNKAKRELNKPFEVKKRKQGKKLTSRSKVRLF